MRAGKQVIFIFSDHSSKLKILIVDDSEMNRSILADMLGDEYEIMEAQNGAEALAILQKHSLEIALVLLDVVMPQMDGFGVLSVMNQKQWIEEIPVIMISAESSSSQVERAYELGVTDFIARPFDALIVHRRVVNTILLYAKQKRLVGIVADQIYEKERTSSLMVNILSHIVEFRNGESGRHIIHVRTLTELLLRQLLQITNRYPLSEMEISLITTASALHDSGKIAIDEKILNKPGRLTEEECAHMKTHSLVGAEMLARLPAYQDEPLIRTACEICRWHHERYDGHGYPDGLKGDEIPISAQIVALADVYDALTSERVYKPAFTHEKALEMIQDGKCGAFSPLLLECLRQVAPTLQEELKKAINQADKYAVRNMTQELLRHEELVASERSLRLLDRERMKYNFFAAVAEEIQFEYSPEPAMLTLSAWGARRLGLNEVIMDPEHDLQLSQILGPDVWRELSKALHSTTPERPVVNYECPFSCSGEVRWYRIVTQALWSGDEPPQYMGAIGKAMDIHDSHMKLTDLEKRASHDSLTGLLNHASAQERIRQRMADDPDGHYALVMLDLDRFKSANDNFGHIFGDRILQYVARKLKNSTRGGDIVARVGGDEFLIFLEYDQDVEPIIRRIFNTLNGEYEGFSISISMGVARTTVAGEDYTALFHAADQALYAVKRSGRRQYLFYDSSMKQMLSAISPIDSETEGKQGGDNK